MKNFRLRKIFLLTITLALCLFALTPLALADDGPPPPGVSARAVVLINADTGQVLYSLNPDEPMAMASTTKMMTALLTMENVKDLNAMVTTSQRAAEVGESSVWLTAGETLTVQEMLTGMLVQSGNDAATALAEYQSGTVEAFVDKMNKRAAELGMKNTHFANPHGLDDPAHYTSAADFARLGTEVMKFPLIREIVKSPYATIPWTGQPFGRSLTNHNHLLEQNPYINGIKTGYTDNAGQCIVISASENGVNLVLAYLGGLSLSQRDSEVVSLVRYGFDSYQQRTVIEQGTRYASIDIPFEWGRKMELASADNLVKTVYVKDNVVHQLTLPEEVELPLHKGDKIGIVEAYDGGRLLGSSYLLATEDVPEPGYRERVTYYIHSVFNLVLSVIITG
ncbi:MAG: D-alanyl-D-alanine carboxypeptidase family protein [Thermoleophilia bacterium]